MVEDAWLGEEGLVILYSGGHEIRKDMVRLTKCLHNSDEVF